jgi:2-hydroxycyclohexanecarboxyl-CoA dehydrogenase
LIQPEEQPVGHLNAHGIAWRARVFHENAVPRRAFACCCICLIYVNQLSDQWEQAVQRLLDRTVVVTGGGGGIGGATCRRFAAEGARVAVLDLSLPAAEKVAAEMRAAGGAAQAFRCDITERAEVDAALAATEAAFGPVDVLVNNAGWDVFKPFAKTEPAQWSRLIDVNLVGALHMHHAVLPGMVARRRGRIVNVASDAARVGSSGEAVYAACKGGLVAFSKTIAREHARHGITVNVVCPGPTDTALFADYKQGAGNPEKLVEAFERSIPLGRIGQPDDLPGAIVFFASDDAAYITGQVLSVSGGLTMHG